MARSYYSEDDDLIKIRPNILSLGVRSWEEQSQEAFKVINRVLTRRWYRPAAIERGIDPDITQFSPDQVDATQLVKLSCYKTLELAYEILMKDGSDSDGFERHSNRYGKKYVQELKDLLADGISYDWDASADITSTERHQRTPRRLYRA